jgi:general stress protein 26
MPTAHLDSRFSTPGAGPVAWEEVQRGLGEADLFWVVTVRADGRPHVTPLLAVVLDDVLHFCTGPTEQKAKNLATNPHCSLLTGNGTRLEGLDLVVEGTAVRVTDESLLRRLADEWVRKYGQDWRFEVVDGAFVHANDSLRGGRSRKRPRLRCRPAQRLRLRQGRALQPDPLHVPQRWWGRGSVHGE